MAWLRKLIGMFLLAAAVASLCVSVEITNVDEQISVIVSSAFTFMAGFLSYRGHRLWSISVALASLLYCYLVALTSSSMLLSGMFQVWWSSLALPMRDPTIHWFAKASLIYFQGVLPPAFVVVAIVSLTAAFMHNKASGGEPASRP
jgi:hypothetical protein